MFRAAVCAYSREDPKPKPKQTAPEPVTQQVPEAAPSKPAAAPSVSAAPQPSQATLLLLQVSFPPLLQHFSHHPSYSICEFTTADGLRCTDSHQSGEMPKSWGSDFLPSYLAVLGRVCANPQCQILQALIVNLDFSNFVDGRASSAANTKAAPANPAAAPQPQPKTTAKPPATKQAEPNGWLEEPESVQQPKRPSSSSTVPANASPAKQPKLAEEPPANQSQQVFPNDSAREQIHPRQDNGHKAPICSLWGSLLEPVFSISEAHKLPWAILIPFLAAVFLIVKLPARVTPVVGTPHFAMSMLRGPLLIFLRSIEQMHLQWNELSCLARHMTF